MSVVLPGRAARGSAMLEFPRWKYFVILLVLAISALYALPNVYQSDNAVQITANRGASLDDALRARVQADLEKAGLTPKSVAIEGDSLMVDRKSTRLNSSHVKISY